MRQVLTSIMKVFGQLFFLYGLLGWIYGIIIQVTHPSWLNTTLSHLTLWIRVDTFAVSSFIISILGFLIWKFTRELEGREKKSNYG